MSGKSYKYAPEPYQGVIVGYSRRSRVREWLQLLTGAAVLCAIPFALVRLIPWFMGFFTGVFHG